MFNVEFRSSKINVQGGSKMFKVEFCSSKINVQGGNRSFFQKC
jgi:hypothetical protein